MNDLERSIKRFNLIYTDTLHREDLTRNDIDIENMDVNYDKSVSLYELICSFNKAHLMFKEDYNYVHKLNLGKKVEIDNYLSFTDDDNNKYRVLTIYIHNPSIINSEYTYLYLREINGKVRPFVSNDINFLDDDYYRINVRLNEKRAKEYLDLFDKYSLLFELYRFLKAEIIYNDPTFSLFTRIDSDKNSFLDSMNNFTISLGAGYSLSPGDHITASINLGKKIDVDLDNSLIELNGKKQEINKVMILDILKNVYVNGKYLERRTVHDYTPKYEEKVKLLTKTIK